jgi:hypothetical protein
MELTDVIKDKRTVRCWESIICIGVFSTDS